MKYWPVYPRKPFTDLEAARAWVASFVTWYNETHLHSAIGFVTPADRHAGRAGAILERRRRVYEEARRRNPARWSGDVRTWASPEVVVLNPAKDPQTQAKNQAIAA